MKSLLLNILLLSVLVFDVTTLWCQTSAHAELSAPAIFVGEQVELRAKVSARNNQEVIFPEFDYKQEIVKGVEVLSCEKIDTTILNNGKIRELSRKYILTSFDSALYLIPPLEFKIDDSIYSSNKTLGLKVSWVDVDTTQLNTFEGPHEGVPVKFIWVNRSFVKSTLLWCLLPLLFFVIGFWTIKKTLVISKTIIKSKTPNEQANADIDQLEYLIKTNDDKNFYIGFSQSIKVYLESRFGLRTIEKTTSEILEQTKETLNKEHQLILSDALNTADLVKFANCSSSDFEQKDLLKKYKTFVQDNYDHELEHPKPVVEKVVLNDSIQRIYKIGIGVMIFCIIITISYITLNMIWDINFIYF